MFTLELVGLSGNALRKINKVFVSDVLSAGKCNEVLERGVAEGLSRMSPNRCIATNPLTISFRSLHREEGPVKRPLY